MNRIPVLILALFSLVLLSTNVYAKDASRDKLLELAKVTGIYEQVEQQKTAMKEQGGQAANQYTQQLFAALPTNLPPEFEADFRKEFDNYMKNISDIIDTDLAVNSYIDLIGKKLNENDVESIIAFYNSNVGKKYTQSNIEISGSWAKIFMENADKKLMVHLQQYLENLKAIIAKYSNQK